MSEKGLIKSTLIPVKVLGNGELDSGITVSAHSFSETAKNKIEKAGGKVIVV